MKNQIPLCAVIVAGLALTACANRPQTQAVWNATPGATVSQEQANAKCDYEIAQSRGAFTELSLYAGQPRLSEFGLTLYKNCMMAQGYRFGGTVPYTGGAS